MDLNDENLAKVQAGIKTSGHSWKAGKNGLFGLSDHEARMRGGNTLSDEELDEREAKAKANLSHHKPSPYSSIDWRNVEGNNYIDPVRDQGKCCSCVAFGTLAATAARARIKKVLPVNASNGDQFSPFSTAQFFYCVAERLGSSCESGWEIRQALKCLHLMGAYPESCFKYTPGDQACKSSSTCEGKETKISGSSSSHHVMHMKKHLRTDGPLITSMSLYEDLHTYVDGVYLHSKVGKRIGGHCVAVIGYNDNIDYMSGGKAAKGAWLIKNSWGEKWGLGGYGWIGYGECGIDSEMWYSKGFSTIYLSS